MNIYAPTHRPDHPSFWRRILDEHSALNLPNPDFMLRDFNIMEDPIDRVLANPDNQAAVAALRELRLAWNLEDTWRHLHPRDCAYTYRATSNGQQIMSRLDRIYIARHLRPLTFDWKLEPSLVPTDHWLVKVKYAPLDAPLIGKGRWTWPLHSLSNPHLLEAVSEHGLKLQEDLAHLSTHNVERSTSNPQLLWNECKKDFSLIAKKHMRESYHKISTCIDLLEKDRKQLTRHPNFDTDNDLRTREAILANELDHLRKIKSLFGNFFHQIMFGGDLYLGGAK